MAMILQGSAQYAMICRCHGNVTPNIFWTLRGFPLPSCSGRSWRLSVWGELRLDVPTALQGINDKFLHFGAYLILGALAGGAIKQRRLLKWAVLGLIVFDAMIYFILHRRPAPLHRLSGQRGLAAQQAGRQIDNRQ